MSETGIMPEGAELIAYLVAKISRKRLKYYLYSNIPPLSSQKSLIGWVQRDCVTNYMS